MFETAIRGYGAIQNNYQALQGFNAPKESGWAICNADDLSDAVEFTAFMNMDYSGECKIISSPVEEGGFVSYNRTSTPAAIGLQVAIKGTPDDLMDALVNLEVMMEQTDLLTLITPDNVYQDYNMVKLQYSRKPEDGLDVAYIDIGLEEVRQVESKYTNTKVAPEQKRGRVQAKSTDTASASGSAKAKQAEPTSAITSIRDYIRG